MLAYIEMSNQTLCGERFCFVGEIGEDLELLVLVSWFGINEKINTSARPRLTAAPPCVDAIEVLQRDWAILPALEIDTTSVHPSGSQAPIGSLTGKLMEESINQLQIFGLYKTWENKDIRIRKGISFTDPVIYHSTTSIKFGGAATAIHLRTCLANEKTKIVASCVLNPLPGSTKLNLGEPGNLTQTVQMAAKKSSWLGSPQEYAFSPLQTTLGSARELIWHRGPKQDVCRNVTTGAEIARFTKNEPLTGSKLGSLHFMDSSSHTDFEQLLLMSWLAVHEKEMKRAKTARVWTALVGRNH